MMAHVKQELQSLLSQAATCVANDDLTGARDRFIRAVSMIDVTVGSAPSLPADDVTGSPPATTKKSRSKKAGRRVRRPTGTNRRRG